MIEIKTADDLIDRYNAAAEVDSAWLGWFVVLANSLPWIVFQNEDGDTWAQTAASEDPTEPSVVAVERLFDGGLPVYLLSDGRPPATEATWDEIEPGWRVVVRLEDEDGRYDERCGVVDQHRYLRDVHGCTFIESYLRHGWTLVSAEPPAGGRS